MEKGKYSRWRRLCSISMGAKDKQANVKNVVTRESACGTSRRVHLIPDRRLVRHDMGNKRSGEFEGMDLGLVQLVLAASIFELGGTFATTPFALFSPHF
jgi:hypothetical protein